MRHVTSVPRLARTSLHLTLVALGATACDSPPTSAPNDAAVDAPSVDAPAVDAVDVGGPADVPAADTNTCVDFSGGYTPTGDCGEPTLGFGLSCCIAQTGCEARISLLGRTTTGTVEGDTLRFESALTDGDTLSCTATMAGRELRMSCTSGTGLTCEVTGRSDGVTAGRYCCDLVAQDCGAGQRCALFANDRTNFSVVTACVPAGTGALGAPCTNAMRLGAEDGCGPGLQCTAHTTPSATCQALCREDAHCGAGRTCVRTASEPASGLCVTTCAVGGSECVEGTTCRGVAGAFLGDDQPRIHAACERTGPAVEGQVCASVACQAGLICANRNTPNFRCRPACDMGHPCPAGQVCAPLSGINPRRIGGCFPTA